MSLHPLSLRELPDGALQKTFVIHFCKNVKALGLPKIQFHLGRRTSKSLPFELELVVHIFHPCFSFWAEDMGDQLNGGE